MRRERMSSSRPHFCMVWNNWLRFFRGVETTNPINIHIYIYIWYDFKGVKSHIIFLFVQTACWRLNSYLLGNDGRKIVCGSCVQNVGPLINLSGKKLGWSVRKLHWTTNSHMQLLVFAEVEALGRRFWNCHDRRSKTFERCSKPLRLYYPMYWGLSYHNPWTVTR